jgi:HEAT repeat protein
LSLDSRLVLTLGGSARVAVASGATPDGWQRQSAHVLGVSEAARLRALEARVAGLTLADVQSAIRLVDGSAPTEATTAFLWRAVGLLKLDPTLAAAVGELAADPATSEAGRALALDLLVSAGHREAQAALRQAIASRAGQADAASCVTRLALVQNPDPATVSMALGELTSETSTPETRDAAALAVGALADWTGRRGDSERSKELLAALTERLDHATSTADRVTGLRALGNAGGEAILSSVTSQITHEDGEVRAAAALALRDVPPESSAPVLSGLLADPDADVQHAALTTLFEQTLEEDVQTQVVTTLLDALANGTLSPRLHAKALELADQRVADPELGVKLAEAIRAATSEPAIRTAASSVIAALTAAL